MQPGRSRHERKAHIVLLEDLADFLDVLVEKILFLMMLHPVRHQRSARLTIPVIRLRTSGTSSRSTRVNRHVIHALLGLLLDHFAHQFERQSSAAAPAKSLHRLAPCPLERARLR